MANDSQKLIRFDWAMKHLLRDKANFDILEGFLSALLCEDITVLNLAESESNQEDETDKFNRVDLLVEDSKKRKVIIEIQNNRESHYLERLLYGTSKVIVENLSSGDLYKNVVKVLSISILYFDLGVGDDYIYYGNTDFKGIHTHKPLIVKERVYLPDVFEPKFQMKEKNVFPEYYLIRVEKFEDIIESPVDEWIYMIKHSEVRDSFQSKNIVRAREKLNLMKMPVDERRKYEKYLSNLASEQDVVETAREEGMSKGIAKGRAEESIKTEAERRKAEQEKQRAEQEKQRAEQEKQRAEQERQKREEAEDKLKNLAKNLKTAGVESALISRTTGLSLEEIEKI